VLWRAGAVQGLAKRVGSTSYSPTVLNSGRRFRNWINPFQRFWTAWQIIYCVLAKNYCHVTWLQDLGKVTWTTRDYQFHFWHPIHNAKRCFFWQDLSRCQNRRNVFQTVLYPQCLWRSSTQYLILMDKSLSQARLSATTIITSCTVRPHWVRPVARSQGMTNSTCRLPGAQVGFVNIVNEDCRVDAWS